MIRYKHTQFGWVIVIGLLLAGAALLITAVSTKGVEHFKNGLLLGSFIIFTCLLLFDSLTTVVTDEYIRVYFGRGLIHKTIPLENIIQCNTVQNSFVLGWGIRFGLGFTLWNVSGFNSVELTLKNKKWKFRIGTDKSEELFQAIATVLKERQLSGRGD